MIPIFKPYMPENISENLEKILYSGRLAYGKYGKRFESRLAAYIGCENVLTVSTYNQAMLIILSTLDIKQGDEIIASPVSCLASNQPFVIKGAKIIWADVNPNTGLLDLESVRNSITSNTKAIFHNHYCGYVGDVDEINSLAKEHGIYVVDDCIEAFGSEYKGKKTGNLGTDATIFSFQTIRLPNTIDGAAIVFNDVNKYKKAKKIRDYGINRTKFRDELNEINPGCDITLEGYGGLMSEINSYIGLCQLDDIDSLLNKQMDNAQAWKLYFEESLNFVRPLENTKPNYWVIGILTKNKIETIKSFREKGYYATGVHINNNIYSIFNNKIYLKGVSEFMDSFIALPTGWWIKELNF